MQFKYIASHATGKIVEDTIDAKDKTEVLKFLTARGLKPIRVTEVSQSILRFKKALSVGSINITDLIFLSKYLALMLKLGTDLLKAINILIQDFQKASVKSFLLEMRENVEKGMPFYATFAKYPKVFSEVYINLVKVGESSGNLDTIFADLADMLDKQKTLRDQIKGALMYPFLLLSGSVVLLFFLVTFALPKIAKVFTEGGIEPPAFSKIVFSIGFFFNDHVFLILGLLIVIVLGASFLFKFSLVFQRVTVGFIRQLPIFKDLFKKIALQRFGAVLSLLIKAGMPLTVSLEITAKAVGNFELREALLRISKEGLTKGLSIGEAFYREPFFPRTVVNLMVLSEKSGKLEYILETLSDFYAKEINSSVKILVSFLEPVMLILIGGVIGIIALSIIVPIYQLTTQF